MSYLSLYREFRPRVFDEVMGQEHITVTLINQIKSGRVGHAYLFAGSRGVGKTTCARIFARAINCINPQNGSPCYQCEVCLKLENPSNLDITEIDAASNNGVDDARELREKVKYPPLYGKYKVFIIDEVHMLSGSAFNALLKTLEEPPSHVVFILATTETHKLPATILSRVMRFDFRLIPTQQIMEIVADVYKKSNKEFEQEAIKYIAMLGEGSVRDALSIADRCLSISGGKLTYDEVLNLLGAAGREETKNLILQLASGNIGGALDIVDTLIKSGKSVGMIAKDLLSTARDLLVVKTAPDILDIPKTEKDSLLIIAKDYSVDVFATFIKIFAAIEAELRYSVSPRIVIETACIKACNLAVLDLSAINSRLAKLEKTTANFENLAISNNVSANHNASVGMSNAGGSESFTNINVPKPIVNNFEQVTIPQPKPILENNHNAQPLSQNSATQNSFLPPQNNVPPPQNVTRQEDKKAVDDTPPWENKQQKQVDDTPPWENKQQMQVANDAPPWEDVPPPEAPPIQIETQREAPPILTEIPQVSVAQTEIPQVDVAQTERRHEDVGQTEPAINQQNSADDLPSARSLWGRVLRHVRTNSAKMLYDIASEIANVRLEGRTMVIVCGKDNYLQMSSDQIMEELYKAVKDFGYSDVKFVTELVSTGIDTEKEIQKLKAMVGDTPFFVK